MSTDIEDRLARLSDWLAAEHSDYVPVLREASSLIHDLREQVAASPRSLQDSANYWLVRAEKAEAEVTSLRAERDALRKALAEMVERVQHHLCLTPPACAYERAAALLSPERSSSTAE